MSWRNPLLDKTYTAGGTINPYRFVKFGGSDTALLQAAAATDALIGVSGQVGAASGEVLYLREGNPVDAWTVIAMTDRALVIGTSEINVTFSLFEEDQPVAPDAYLDAQPETSP
jgi:hypothetical protein